MDLIPSLISFLAGEGGKFCGGMDINIFAAVQQTGMVLKGFQIVKFAYLIVYHIRFTIF